MQIKEANPKNKLLKKKESRPQFTEHTPALKKNKINLLFVSKLMTMKTYIIHKISRYKRNLINRKIPTNIQNRMLARLEDLKKVPKIKNKNLILWRKVKG